MAKLKRKKYDDDIRLRSAGDLKKRLMKIASIRKTSMSALVRNVLEAACDYYEQRILKSDPSIEQVLHTELEKDRKPGTERISRFQHRQE